MLETELRLDWVPQPAAVLYLDRDLNADPTNWFAFNERALVGLLRRSGFRTVEVVDRTPVLRRLGRMIYYRVRHGAPMRQYGSRRIVIHATRRPARQRSAMRSSSMTRSVDDHAWMPTRLPHAPSRPCSADASFRLSTVRTVVPFTDATRLSSSTVTRTARSPRIASGSDALDVRDRVPELPVGPPLADEVAATLVDRVDVERVPGHAAVGVDLGAEEDAEARSAPEVHVGLEREVGRGGDVGERPALVGATHDEAPRAAHLHERHRVSEFPLRAGDDEVLRGRRSRFGFRFGFGPCGRRVVERDRRGIRLLAREGCVLPLRPPTDHRKVVPGPDRRGLVRGLVPNERRVPGRGRGRGRGLRCRFGLAQRERGDSGIRLGLRCRFGLAPRRRGRLRFGTELRERRVRSAAERVVGGVAPVDIEARARRCGVRFVGPGHRRGRRRDFRRGGFGLRPRGDRRETRVEHLGRLGHAGGVVPRVRGSVGAVGARRPVVRGGLGALVRGLPLVRGPLVGVERAVGVVGRVPRLGFGVVPLGVLALCERQVAGIGRRGERLVPGRCVLVAAQRFPRRRERLDAPATSIGGASAALIRTSGSSGAAGISTTTGSGSASSKTDHSSGSTTPVSGAMASNSSTAADGVCVGSPRRASSSNTSIGSAGDGSPYAACALIDASLGHCTASSGSIRSIDQFSLFPNSAVGPAGATRRPRPVARSRRRPETAGTLGAATSWLRRSCATVSSIVVGTGSGTAGAASGSLSPVGVSPVASSGVERGARNSDTSTPQDPAITNRSLSGMGMRPFSYEFSSRRVRPAPCATSDSDSPFRRLTSRRCRPSSLGEREVSVSASAMFRGIGPRAASL